MPIEDPPSLIRVTNYAEWIAKDPRFLHADSEDSDLSLRWANRSFCWFSHVQAQFIVITCLRFKTDRKVSQMQCCFFRHMVSALRTPHQGFALNHREPKTHH